MKHYDYIIAGAGCAGLSLAYYLSQSPLRNKSVLLIDKAPKTENDRTWCFWEAGENPFETLVYRKWSQVDFYGAHFSDTLNLGEYRYKMIRGSDFYRYIQETLHQYSNFEWAFGTINSIQDQEDRVEVLMNSTSYTASWVFSSLYDATNLIKQKGYHYLLQHFKGWEIQTEAPAFNPEKATLMDFRINQNDETRFFYVLPLDAHRALVEFTAFSEHLLVSELYDAELKAYIADYLSISSYTIHHQEFGVIPMFDQPFPAQSGKRIIHIGTAGGQTKASTGYTFLRIQHHTQALVQRMIERGKLVLGDSSLKAGRYKLYDSMLLNIMAKKRYPIKEVFTLLFKRNNPSTILKFLDEETTLGEELRIFATTPYRPFLAALIDVLVHKKHPLQ